MLLHGNRGTAAFGAANILDELLASSDAQMRQVEPGWLPPSGPGGVAAALVARRVVARLSARTRPNRGTQGAISRRGSRRTAAAVRLTSRIASRESFTMRSRKVATRRSVAAMGPPRPAGCPIKGGQTIDARATTATNGDHKIIPGATFPQGNRITHSPRGFTRFERATRMPSTLTGRFKPVNSVTPMAAPRMRPDGLPKYLPAVEPVTPSERTTGINPK